MAFNERNHPQLGMFSLQVKEARRNTQLAKDFPEPKLPNFLGANSAQELVRKLAQQGPNRIKVSLNGWVSRIVMWQGTDFRFEAYMETVDLKADPIETGNGTPPIVRSEWLIASSPKDIETAISLWGARHQTTGDLTLKPDVILESTTREGDLIHLRGAEDAYCRYIVSNTRGVRVLDLGFGDFRMDPKESFRILPAVPPQTHAYAFPFAA